MGQNINWNHLKRLKDTSSVGPGINGAHCWQCDALLGWRRWMANDNWQLQNSHHKATSCSKSAVLYPPGTRSVSFGGHHSRTAIVDECQCWAQLIEPS